MVTAFSLVASPHLVAPPWKARVDLEIWDHYCHHQHHPRPLPPSLRTSCFLFPASHALLPHLFLITAMLHSLSPPPSPPQRMKYRKNHCGQSSCRGVLQSPSLLLPGSENVHPFVLLTAKPTGPVRSHCWILQLTSPGSKDTPSEVLLCQLSGA